MPYNSPSIPELSTRFDYYRNHQLFSYNANYYYGNYTNSHIILEMGVQHIDSNYTTSVPYGTDVPRISVALLDGTLVNDTTKIILDDSLSPWTKNCNRTSDGALFGSVPLKISVSFDKPISSLATHKLAIIARMYSNNAALTNQLQSYSDQMIVSITVAPGNLPDILNQRVMFPFSKSLGYNGSTPISSSCNNGNRTSIADVILKIKLCFYSEGVNGVPFFNISGYEVLPSHLNSVSGPIYIPNVFPFGNSYQIKAYVRIYIRKFTHAILICV